MKKIAKFLNETANKKAFKIVTAEEIPTYMRHPDLLKKHIKEQETALKNNEDNLTDTKNLLKMLEEGGKLPTSLSHLEKDRTQAIAVAKKNIIGLESAIKNIKDGIDKYNAILKEMR